MTHRDNLLAAAKAEDVADLLNHIGWTDVIRPKLQATVQQYASILVAEALGAPLPGGKTREQIAGIAYGINYLCSLLEQILREGKRALDALDLEGISIQHLER